MRGIKTQENLLNNTRKYRKTKKGILTNIYNHCKNRKIVEFTLKEFQDKYIDDENFIRLYNQWVKYNYQTKYKPTIDRIDCLKNYSFNNIHWLTWEENRYKQRMEFKRIRAKKIAMLKDEKIVKIFNSQRQAVIETKLHQSDISNCLNGKRKSCGGYTWQYIFDNPDLLGE